MSVHELLHAVKSNLFCHYTLRFIFHGGKNEQKRILMLKIEIQCYYFKANKCEYHNKFYKHNHFERRNKINFN